MITGYTTTRLGNTTLITATSSLTGTVYYYWYLDGSYLGVSADPTWTISLEAGDFGSIVAIDSTTTPDSFDIAGNAPVGWPARRTLFFVRSIDANIAKYKIEEQANGGAWTVLGNLQDDVSRWDYTFTSSRLTDLTSYAWRVTPIDQAGNAGTPLALAAEYIVRTPDAPGFSATVQVSTRVLFASA